jgi:hypothetical protein
MYTYWTTDTIKVPYNDTVKEITKTLKNLRYVDGVEIKVEALRTIEDIPDGTCLITIKHLEDGCTY